MVRIDSPIQLTEAADRHIVRSSLYSFSFEQCPTWSEEFPRQQELLVFDPYLLGVLVTDGFAGLSHGYCPEIRPLSVHPVQLNGGGSALGRQSDAMEGTGGPDWRQR